MRLFTVLLLFALFALPALAEPGTADVPITRVTLYTSGVGYFERSGAVDGDAQKTLLFPVGQVNDVLKSLVLLDLGGGSIRPVTYGALDPVSKQLQSFSVDVSDNPDRATLLNRLRGASITVTYDAGGPGAQILTGVVVSVESQTISLANNATTQQSTLNVMSDDGVHSLALTSVLSFQVDDPDLRNELHAALATVAQGRDASKRPVTLNFAGRGRRSVVVGYLTETPLWQTSYRLVLGKTPQIQGWALVQNTGQDDWDNVTLSLVSGRPISFIQDLYTPTYIPRQVVQANVIGSPTPQTYASNLDKDVQDAISAQSPSVGGSISEASREAKKTSSYQFPGLVSGVPGVTFDPSGGYVHLRGSDQNATGFQVDGISNTNKNDNQFTTNIVSMGLKTSGAQLGASLFSYNIKDPVSVPRQQSAMIPFVGAGIKAQRVSIYNESTESDHPLTGARLTNTTGLHLMGGPLTIFDEETSGGTGYVGDALIDDTEPGQTRLLSYAVDLAVDADAKNGASTNSTLAVTIVDGVLNIKDEETAAKVYTFKNNAAGPRLIVVEHPNSGEGWSLIEPAKADERTKEVLRFDVPLASKESKTFKVVERKVDTTGYRLIDTGSDTLVYYAKSGEASDAVKAALHEIATRRQAIAQTQAQIANADSALNDLASGQDRIRKNMGALDHASALYKRYVTELDAQETRLSDLQTQKETLQKQLTQQQADLAAYVGKLNLE